MQLVLESNIRLLLRHKIAVLVLINCMYCTRDYGIEMNLRLNWLLKVGPKIELRNSCARLTIRTISCVEFYKDFFSLFLTNWRKVSINIIQNGAAINYHLFCKHHEIQKFIPSVVFNAHIIAWCWILLYGFPIRASIINRVTPKTYISLDTARRKHGN